MIRSFLVSMKLSPGLSGQEYMVHTLCQVTYSESIFFHRESIWDQDKDLWVSRKVQEEVCVHNEPCLSFGLALLLDCGERTWRSVHMEGCH